MRSEEEVTDRRALCQAQINSARKDSIELELVKLEESILGWVLGEDE